jgi:hypothetical protein
LWFVLDAWFRCNGFVPIFFFVDRHGGLPPLMKLRNRRIILGANQRGLSNIDQYAANL